MEPRAVELFEGDSASHLKITSPAIREAFNKVMGKWAFGSQEHKNIAAQLCRDVQYEYKSRHKIDLRIEGMEWRGVVPHVVLSGSNPDKNKAYFYRNIHGFFAYAPYPYPDPHITSDAEIAMADTALWQIQDLFALYATPLPIKFGKVEKTKYNVVIRFLGICSDSGARVIGLTEFQRKRREQVKSLLIQVGRWSTRLGKSLTNVFHLGANLTVQGGYKNRFEIKEEPKPVEKVFGSPEAVGSFRSYSRKDIMTTDCFKASAPKASASSASPAVSKSSRVMGTLSDLTHRMSNVLDKKKESVKMKRVRETSSQSAQTERPLAKSKRTASDAPVSETSVAASTSTTSIPVLSSTFTAPVPAASTSTTSFPVLSPTSTAPVPVAPVPVAASTSTTTSIPVLSSTSTAPVPVAPVPVAASTAITAIPVPSSTSTAQARIVQINFAIMQYRGRIAGLEAEREMLENML
ncbi:hypothetical protein FFLO_06504 [Filobasidium floriforme]|uniref:Uncharacterized protein n=1 Tax=Filobasidium floriforme TaxID=5210 RepID=A0A8K0NMT4_9TREE|nr:hypothetical protein FFLO_06504 [Filobasidium floriforme]